MMDLIWVSLILDSDKAVMEHLDYFHTFLPARVRPPLSTLNGLENELLTLGPGNKLDSLIRALFMIMIMTRLGTVRFPSSSSVALRQSDHPSGRVLKVKSVIRKEIVLS